MKKSNKQWYYHMMLLPGIVLLLIFTYAPMCGIVMAFQNYVPAKGIMGSKFVGLANFKTIFSLRDSKQIFINTIIISAWKIGLRVVVPVSFALLINEVSNKMFKKSVQTICYIPHFLSWVVFASIVTTVFSLNGPINQVMNRFGFESIYFLGSNLTFRNVMIFSDIWKEFGYSSIVYFAAITGIDPGLYEAASLDGANRFDKLIHITLPGIFSIIIVMFMLDLPNILNAGFDQIYSLYNPLVYDTGDILDTFVYRMGLTKRQYSIGTAVGLIKSTIGMFLIIIANKIVNKYTDRRVF